MIDAPERYLRRKVHALLRSTPRDPAPPAGHAPLVDTDGKPEYITWGTHYEPTACLVGALTWLAAGVAVVGAIALALFP